MILVSMPGLHKTSWLPWVMRGVHNTNGQNHFQSSKDGQFNDIAGQASTARRNSDSCCSILKPEYTYCKAAVKT